MFTSISLLSALVNPVLAGDNLPLSSGEIGNSAHVLESGDQVGTLGLKYSLGANNTTQINIRALFGGPGAGIEKMVLNGDSLAASVYVDLTGFYLNQSLYTGVSGGGILTIGGPDRNRLNFNAGGAYQKVYLSDDPVYELTTNLGVTYHLRASDKTTWEFYGNVDPYNSLVNSSLEGSAGFRWIHGFWFDNWNNIRVSLGLEMRSNASYEQALETAGQTIDIPVMPLPTAQIWWRF